MSRRRDQPIGCMVRGGMLMGGLLFIAMGLPFVWLMLVQPLRLLVSTRSWSEARCEVLYVGVQAGEPRKKASIRYRPLVAFAYSVDGREHVGAAFEPSPQEYSTEELARAHAQVFKPGTHVACHVDPADPRRAVLLRRFNPEMLLGLLPGLFPLVGLLVCWGALAMGRGTPAAQSVAGWLPASREVLASANRPVLTLEELQHSSAGVALEPQSTPLGTFVGLLFANLVWNGICGAFLFLMWKDAGGWSALAGPGLCFMIFPLIGLLLLISLPYQFLALFNPRPHLTLSRATIRPGESVRLRFELRPLGFRARRVQLLLEGREQVVTTSGGSSSPASAGRHVFHAATLLDRRAPESRSEGEVTLEIPSGAMHSFRSGPLELAWVVRVVADITFFPDVTQEFTLTVLPEGRQR